jgi:hypothetical protein
VIVDRYSISYASPGATEPTEEEYNGMLNITTAYFTDVFDTYWANNPSVTFLGINSSIVFTAFEDPNLPTAGQQYNIYMDYNFSNFLFTPDSVLPTSDEIFSEMRDSIDATYITDWVWQLKDSPFATVNAVYFQASQEIAPAASP